MNFFGICLEENEKYGMIEVSNINTYNFFIDIKNIWKTTTLEKYMFYSVGRFSFKFKTFYVADFAYMLDKMIANKRRYTALKTLLALKEQLATNTWWRDTFIEHPSRLDFKQLETMKFSLLPRQLEALHAYNDKVTKLHLNGYLLAAEVGTGKAQPLNSGIRTPTGWALMGAIKVGDSITAFDGTPTTVIGVHPQGYIDIVKVTFEDGRSTECSLDHLWDVSNYPLDCGISDFKTRETSFLITGMQQGATYYIPVIKPELHIDSTISNGYEAGYTLKEHNDESIEDIIMSFLNTSFEQKTKFLQGILNSAPFTYDHNGVCISSPNYDFIYTLQEFIWSMGGIAKLSSVYYDNASSYIHRVTFILPDTEELLNGLGKPIDKWLCPIKQENLKLRIVSIKYIGKKHAQCISIDHPSQLYITDDYIATHNSIMGCGLYACLKPDALVIVCPKHIVDSVWVDAINVQFHGKKTIYAANTGKPITKEHDVYIIHYEAIKIANDFFSKNKVKNSVIILDESHNLNDPSSQRTIQYLELCKTLKCKNIIHESGTPIKAIAKEAIPLLKAIDPYFTDKVEEGFKAIYGRSASLALEIVNNRLGLVSYKLPSSVVMGEAKPIRKELKVKLPKPEKFTIDFIKGELVNFRKERLAFYAKDADLHEKNYLDAIDYYKSTITNSEDKAAFSTYQNYIATMRKGYDNMSMGPLSQYCNLFEKNKIIPILPNELRIRFIQSKTIYKYVDLKIMGEFLGGVLGRRRAELHSEIIQHSGIDEIVKDAEKKTICFTDYIDTLLTAEKYFISKGFKPALVYAETNKDVNGIINKFRVDEDLNPLLATIKSMSTGVTLTIANVVIFLNLPFRSLDYDQALARVFRIGQDTQVYLYDLVLDTGEVPNLSTRMQDIMNWSADQVEMITDKTSIGYSIEDIISSDDFLNIKTVKKISAVDW